MAVLRTTSSKEAENLIDSGARLLRQSHEMILDLAQNSWPPSVPVTDQLRLEDIRRPPAEIAAAAGVATPAGHPDRETWATVDRASYWAQVLSGRVTGPILTEASGLVVDSSGRVVAALAVTAMAPSDWWPGGPWLTEMFVVPALQNRGLGRRLLAHAASACARAGHGLLGLTVTDGNAAERLYQRFGFKRFRTVWAVETGVEGGRK